MRDAVTDLLRPEIILNISDSGELKVKEDDPCAILKDLLIIRVPENSIAFELDHKPKGNLKKKLGNAFKQLSCLINSSHEKANKKCDFVIITPNELSSKIILGDLKSTKVKREECVDQLKNSELFLNFLINLLSDYHSTEITPEFVKVIFHVMPATNSKVPTQQKNLKAPKKYKDVTFIPVNLIGRNNTQAKFSYDMITQ